jgi:hypothetical protein
VLTYGLHSLPLRAPTMSLSNKFGLAKEDNGCQY